MTSMEGFVPLSDYDDRETKDDGHSLAYKIVKRGIEVGKVEYYRFGKGGRYFVRKAQADAFLETHKPRTRRVRAVVEPATPTHADAAQAIADAVSSLADLESTISSLREAVMALTEQMIKREAIEQEQKDDEFPFVS
jgi:hypothetical protein